MKMSAEVLECLETKAGNKSASNSSEIGNGESPYLDDDSDEFTDWSDDDDNSQNLDDDLESNFSEKRYSGDGEEQPSGLVDRNQRQADDDEDRKNPAYVPRKGSFFEHDLRKGDDNLCPNNNNNANPTIRKVKEKHNELRRRDLWSRDPKWEHDRFDERSQRPKSVHELVTLYGFNIRKESRMIQGSKRYGMKNKMRAPFLNGTPTKRSPSSGPRKSGRTKKDSLRTFIIVGNDGKEGDESSNISSRPNSGRNESSYSVRSNHSLDFDDIRGTNRFIDEPIICFAPKRGEKVDIPPVSEISKIGRAASDKANEVNKPESSGMADYLEEFVDPESFHHGRHFGVTKKKFFAGSGRIPPLESGRGRRFLRNFHQQNEGISSSDETDSILNPIDSTENTWKSFSPIYASIPNDRYGDHGDCRGVSPQYRSRNRLRGKYRATGRTRNYFYDGTFPQDVRLIVMCGGEETQNEDRPEMSSSSSLSSSMMEVRKYSAEKPLLVDRQAGLISEILPPVTCCARTRSTRNLGESGVYSVAKTSAIVNTTTSTSKTADFREHGDPNVEFKHVDPEKLVAKQQDWSANSNKQPKEETNRVAVQKVDLVDDKKGLNDKRYSAQRMGIDGRGRNRPAFNPRFPVPPRNRIFHPNAFNNPSASPFLPTAFILPTGPMFSQRYPSVSHITSGMGRNNVPPLLGLNSHHNPSPHPHQLLALPVGMTPIPFILTSSQALTLPSSHHLPHPNPSPPRLHQSSSSVLTSSQSTPSSNATPASPSFTTSVPSSLSSTSSSVVVSRPTSLFQAGPQRSTPHPKHWLRFNPKHCALLKPLPPFHQQQMHFRPTFSNGNLQMNKYMLPPSMPQSNRTVMPSNSIHVSNMATSQVPFSSSSLTSSSSSSSMVTSSSNLTANIAAVSKLSPLAAAFKSSHPDANNSELQISGDAQAKSNTATMYEITSVQPRYWNKSHKACPIEVRGGTVYFSSELQKFQYKCYPASGSKKGSGGSFGFSDIVYFDTDEQEEGKEEGKKESKKMLSIVDPRTIENNGSGVAVSCVNTLDTDIAATTMVTEVAKVTDTMEVAKVTDVTEVAKVTDVTEVAKVTDASADAVSSMEPSQSMSIISNIFDNSTTATFDNDEKVSVPESTGVESEVSKDALSEDKLDQQ